MRDFPVTGGVLHRKVGVLSAVADVSLRIRTGETFELVGESGCGKSTIARLLVAEAGYFCQDRLHDLRPRTWSERWRVRIVGQGCGRRC